MTMRNALSEIVKQTSSIFPFLIVEGTSTNTEIRGMTEDKGLILRCTPKAPMPELAGEVAISDLNMISGLLGFASYNTDDATFSVGRRTIGGKDVAELFEFKDGRGAGAIFRLTNPDTIEDEKHPPVINTIRWEIEFEPSRSKVSEFQQLASLYGKVASNQFIPRTVGDDLQFMVGEENSSMHSASMVFQEGVGATLKGNAPYSIPAFQSMMKIAGTNPSRLGLTSRGVMGLTVDTPYATYDYVLRGIR